MCMMCWFLSQATEIRSIYADDSNVSIGSLVRENVFSLTRDPIDTFESSAYIDLISVACVKNETLTYCSLHFIDLSAIRQLGMRFFSAAELKKCDVDEKSARISRNRGLGWNLPFPSFSEDGKFKVILSFNNEINLHYIWSTYWKYDIIRNELMTSFFMLSLNDQLPQFLFGYF